MGKKEYNDVKNNIKNNVGSYEERLKVLGEKELYATKVVRVLEHELQKVNEKYVARQISAIELLGVRRLLLGAQELVERCKIEKNIIEKNKELSKSLDLDNTSRVSLLESRKIRANIKDLKKIVDMGIKKTKNLENRDRYLGNVFDYIDQEAKLIESYIDYCLKSEKSETVSEKLDIIEKKIADLFSAQKDYEVQAELTGGKILVKKEGFKI